MKILVLSSSLHPESRSRILAESVVPVLEQQGAEVRFLDLRDHPLPFCDGASAYGDANLPALAEAIEEADAILAASPVYNYDVGANLKNLVELTGRKWQGKVVGFLFCFHDLSAAILYYAARGGDFGRSTARFLAHFAAEDPWVRPAARQRMERAIAAAGRPYRAFDYPDTGHWFAESARPADYRSEAARLALRRDAAFLRAALGPGAGA